MTSLPTQSFNTIVSNTIAGIQGRAAKLINFSVGSVLRAIVEGFGGLFLWFQELVLKLLTAIRLSTSSGTDVDTFTADFMPIIAGSQTAALPGGSPRLGAQAASGQVLFSRFTPGPSSPFIAVGSTIMTLDGTQSFNVSVDTTNVYYSALLSGYTMPAGVSSIPCPVVAAVPGAAGNVAAGAIGLMTSPITGVDQVTNVAAFTNGANQESDGALKARFAAYILGLSRGDNYGLTASILGAAVTLQWTLTENYNYDGSYRPGYFFIVADDGSGNPPPAFLTSITNAANAVRPLGIQCGVFPPVIVFATVSMLITTLPGFNFNLVASQVSAAVSANINALGLGNNLNWSAIAGWAYAVPGVATVTAVLLNGQSGDAATLLATKLTQDRQNTIGYGTIKTASVLVQL